MSMFDNRVFVTSRDGAQLEQRSALKFSHDPMAERKIVNLYPDMRYQSILGFGSAFTESSASVYAQLNETQKKQLMDMCFGSDGLALNLCRTHINSCDFSLSQYCYVDKNDCELKSFSLERDDKLIVPMIKDALQKAEGMMLFSSPWSPPGWMKDTGVMLLGGHLKSEYYGAWALYFVKYVQQMQSRGITIWGVTVQNEPHAVQTWESCIYTAEQTALFVRDYLHPAFKNAGLDVKIFVWDHNREHLYDWARTMHDTPGVAECIEGVAFHGYMGDHFEGVRMAHEVLPDKLMIASEYCTQDSFDGAMEQMHTVIGNFNNHANSWTDWNLLLDDRGGPFHARIGGCHGVMQYDRKEKRLYPTDLYYATAHFSRFVKRGAVRIGTTTYNREIEATAFCNPDGELVLVMMNNSQKAMPVCVRLDNHIGKIKLPEQSFATVIIDK